jgi:hypothetical protein
VCDKCRKKISELKCDASNKQNDYDSDSNEIEQFAKITVIQYLNESLQSIGESPIKMKRLGKGKYLTSKMKRLGKGKYLTSKMKRLGKGKYPTSKMKRIEKAVKTRILNIPKNVNSSAVSPSSDAEILKQFKENFEIQRLQNF